MNSWVTLFVYNYLNFLYFKGHLADYKHCHHFMDIPHGDSLLFHLVFIYGRVLLILRILKC